MNSDARGQVNQETGAGPRGTERRYEKPAVIWRNSMNVRAISVGCAKSAASNPVCATGILS